MRLDAALEIYHGHADRTPRGGQYPVARLAQNLSFPFFDFSAMRGIVLGHEARHVAQRHPPHPVLLSATIPGLRFHRPKNG